MVCESKLVPKLKVIKIVNSRNTDEQKAVLTH